MGGRRRKKQQKPHKKEKRDSLKTSNPSNSECQNDVSDKRSLSKTGGSSCLESFIRWLQRLCCIKAPRDGESQDDYSKKVEIEVIDSDINEINAKANHDLSSSGRDAQLQFTSADQSANTDQCISKMSTSRNTIIDCKREDNAGMQSAKQPIRTDLNIYERQIKEYHNIIDGKTKYGDQDQTRELSDVSTRTPTFAQKESGQYSGTSEIPVIVHKVPEMATEAKVYFDAVNMPLNGVQLEETVINETSLISIIAPDNTSCNSNIHGNYLDESVTEGSEDTSETNDDKPVEEEDWKSAIDDEPNWKMVKVEAIDYNQITDSQSNAVVDRSTKYGEQNQSNANVLSEMKSKEELSVAMEEDKADHDNLALANVKNKTPAKGRNRKRKASNYGNANTEMSSGRNAHSSKAPNSNRHSKSKQEDKSVSPAIGQKPPRGLTNLGNTCFFNAVMQNLNQSFLLEQCLSRYIQDAVKKSGFPLIQAMDNFYGKMNKSTLNVNPREVFNNVCSKSPFFSGGRQQDSHELLRHLLDGLRAEEKEVFPQSERRKILTSVDKVFGGHFLTVYTCEECKMPYHVCEPMLDISLPIAFDESIFDSDEKVDDNTSDQLSLELNSDNELDYHKAAKHLMSPLNEDGMEREKNLSNEQFNKQKMKGKPGAVVRSVLDCLEAFTRVESIKEEYLCMTCNARRASEGEIEPMMTSATKRTLIYNPPALLTLHLKRFEQTCSGFVKCNDTIYFESELDLGPFCSRYCKRNEENEKNIWYSLYGVVSHGGSLNGGHYVAYVKERSPDASANRYLQTQFLDRNYLTNDEMVQQVKDFQDKSRTESQTEWKPSSKSGSWYYVSDSHYSMVQEKEVKRQQAYLLFYERMTRNNMETF